MCKREMGFYVKLLLMTALIVMGGATIAVAAPEPPQSTNYQIEEPEFGAGAALESCSGQYCAQASIGELNAGSGSSPQRTVDFGSVPDSEEPMLEVIVEGGQSDLGVLTTDKTASKTMMVKIRNYLSDGYTLHIIGQAPRYDDYFLKTPTEPITSAPGSEQFALNAVANTVPELGANPTQVPSSEMSFGYVMPDYLTPNLFMYSSGDVIARSESQSGRTDYTISMIVNVADSTPAGHFATDFSAVVIPVF